MPVKFVDLTAQYESIKREIDDAIAQVIRDNAFIGGKYAKAFEESFAEYIGSKHCIGCGNGTDALEILLKGLGLGPGDEVLVPANTFIATSEAVSTVGAQVVFVDCHPRLYTIDVAKIEEKITSKTKAIVAVHLYGLPAEMDEIMSIARKNDLLVIEDCAQAHGAMYKGKRVGTFGNGATFSFFPGKNLGAYGDAGAVLTNDRSLAEKVRMIANHGRLDKYDHKMEGRNSRLDGLQAAILSVKLKRLEKWTELRRLNASIYTERLKNCGVTVPFVPEYARHVYHLYVVQAEQREQIQIALEAAGVQCGVHYPTALPFSSAYKHLGHSAADFPVAHAQMTRIISLPMFAELTEAEIDEVCRQLEAACKPLNTVA